MAKEPGSDRELKYLVVFKHRGTFDKSDRNLFEGQDLDVPTYLRKGIKIAL